MSERCASCTNERAVRCDAIRAIFRHVVGVVLEEDFANVESGDFKGSNVQLESASAALFKDLKDTGCELDLPQLFQAITDEMFAAGTLAALNQLSDDGEDPEIHGVIVTDYLEGVEEIRSEAHDILQTSALAYDRESGSPTSFISELNAGVRYMHARDYCDERGWDPQSLTPEQAQEVEEYLNNQIFPE